MSIQKKTGIKVASEEYDQNKKRVGKRKQLSYIETLRMKSWPGQEGNIPAQG